MAWADGVGRQRPVRVGVGAQVFARTTASPWSDLAARDRMPVPVAGHRHRVDRVDGAAGGAQARDQQPAGGLDRHRDRVAGGVAVLAAASSTESPAVIADAAPGQQLATQVGQGDVVVIFGPVDTAEHIHKLSSLSSEPAGAGQAARVRARSLMEGLEGTAIRLAVRVPSCPQGPGPGWSWRLPSAGGSCGWQRPRPPLPAAAPVPPAGDGRVSRTITVVAGGAGAGAHLGIEATEGPAGHPALPAACRTHLSSSSAPGAGAEQV